MTDLWVLLLCFSGYAVFAVATWLVLDETEDKDRFWNIATSIKWPVYWGIILIIVLMEYLQSKLKRK